LRSFLKLQFLEQLPCKEDTKLASGRVLAIGYLLWGYADVHTSLIRDGMPERTYAYLPIVADDRFSSPMPKDFGLWRRLGNRHFQGLQRPGTGL
jgi:hypothetical protein